MEHLFKKLPSFLVKGVFCNLLIEIMQSKGIEPRKERTLYSCFSTKEPEKFLTEQEAEFAKDTIFAFIVKLISFYFSLTPMKKDKRTFFKELKKSLNNLDYGKTNQK